MSVATAEPEEATSLSQRILNDIRAKIVSGEWVPGARIPFEHELTVQYSCSRMTVNKALTQLAASGLIERRRRSGSFVRQPQSQAAVLEIHDIRAEVEALDLTYGYELISSATRRGKAADAALLGPDQPKSLLALTSRHFADERPFCIEERLISLDMAPSAANEDFSTAAAGPWLLGHVPWSTAEHRISAAGADAATAELLDLDEGAPCLVVERRTWSTERPVTWARFTYPAASHSVVARFEPK